MTFLALFPIDSRKIFFHPFVDYGLNDSRVRLDYDKASLRTCLQVSVDYKGRKLIMQPLVRGYAGRGEYLVGLLEIESSYGGRPYRWNPNFASWNKYVFLNSLDDVFRSIRQDDDLSAEVKDYLLNFFDKNYLQRYKFYSIRLNAFAQMLFYDSNDERIAREYYSSQDLLTLVSDILSYGYSSEEKHVFYQLFFKYLNKQNLDGKALSVFFNSFFTYFIKDCKRIVPNPVSWSVIDREGLPPNAYIYWHEIEKFAKSNSEEGFVLYFLLGAFLHDSAVSDSGNWDFSCFFPAFPIIVKHLSFFIELLDYQTIKFLSHPYSYTLKTSSRSSMILSLLKYTKITRMPIKLYQSDVLDNFDSINSSSLLRIQLFWLLCTYLLSILQNNLLTIEEIKEELGKIVTYSSIEKSIHALTFKEVELILTIIIFEQGRMAYRNSMRMLKRKLVKIK